MIQKYLIALLKYSHTSNGDLRDVTIDVFQRVVLTFKRFDVELDDECSLDNVNVTDGVTGVHLLTRCGNDPPGDVISSSNRLTVVFRTDSSVRGTGFVIKYTSRSFFSGKHTYVSL